jgi:sugar lactone lactonase YvrE
MHTTCPLAGVEKEKRKKYLQLCPMYSGMTIDNEGQLWIAFWGGSCVRRFDLSTGLVTNTIRLPCAHVSSCCWGGAGGKDLFITTARKGLDGATLQSQPLAGSIFVVRGLEPGGPENYRVDK